jgi:hypothetical protein
MFRKAAKFRNEMLTEGFTDNGGAIYSAERILNLLGLRLNYPSLSHGNTLRLCPEAELSIEALAVHKAGGKVLIAHVSPIRDFTRKAIDVIKEGTDEDLETFVRSHYRIVLLTPEETLRLNKQNRSEMTEPPEKRLHDARIELVSVKLQPRKNA